jgi:DNA polymerase-1
VQVGEAVKVADQGGIEAFGTYLGEFEGREWYWDLESNEAFWRVPDIRECIAAPPGYKVLSADYSQIEVKLMARLSGDPVLIAAINSMKDIHCYNATEVFGQRLGFTYEDIWEATQSENAKKHPRHKELKTLRSNIKTVTFGVPYGASAKRVALMTGMTDEKAQEFIDAFFAKFSVLKAWLEGQGNQALMFGWTATPNGRRRFYTMPPNGDPDYDGEIAQIRRWAGNHPIQAANADMLKMAIRLIYERIRGGNVTGPKLYDARLCLVVHDEVVMICKEEDVPAVSEIMHSAMTDAYLFIIPDVWNEIVVICEDIWEKV